MRGCAADDTVESGWICGQHACGAGGNDAPDYGARVRDADDVGWIDGPRDVDGDDAGWIDGNGTVDFYVGGGDWRLT